MAATRQIGALRHYFLPPSETFIYNSLRSLDRYSAKVFAMERREEKKFPMLGVTALRSLPWGKLEALLYRATTRSPRLLRWGKDIQLLHAHMGYTGVHGLWAARRLGVPLVTSFYGNDIAILRSRQRFRPTYWHFWALARRLFRRGDLFLVLSQDMKRQLVALGCPASKIRIVPLGIEMDRFEVQRSARTSQKPQVLMVGREVEKKGFDDGLRACALAREDGAELDVVLLGANGPLKAELQKLAEDLKLPVAWPDPRTSVPEAMARADILLVPSRTAKNGDREGTPTVIVEGSSASLPIVATRHAGIPEQVEDRKTGLLSDERDVEGLAENLSRLAQDPQLRLDLGVMGHKKMQEEYSLAGHCDRLQAAYDELIGSAA
jgi:glycosyltransferase involved in cell wall biosynthesis